MVRILQESKSSLPEVDVHARLNFISDLIHSNESQKNQEQEMRRLELDQVPCDQIVPNYNLRFNINQQNQLQGRLAKNFTRPSNLQSLNTPLRAGPKRRIEELTVEPRIIGLKNQPTLPPAPLMQ